MERPVRPLGVHSPGHIAATDDLAPPPETPADAVPTEQVAAQAPNINSPNIDVISTTAQTTVPMSSMR